MKNQRNLLYLLILFVVTVIGYQELLSTNPIFKHDFVNWDDPVYIFSNPLFDAFSWKVLFSKFFMGNYHPFTLLSLCIDNWIAGENASVFLIHNLILHIGSVFFLFFIGKKIFNDNIAAIFLALLFAVHPVHVESVAWISERKDVLHTFWFLAALFSYLIYSKDYKLKFYILSILFFIAALLSKGQAVTLTGVIILIDWYNGRWSTKKALTEKIPFVLLSLGFGLLAIHAQKIGGGAGQIDLYGWQSFLTGFYGLMKYTLLFILPTNLSCFHPYFFTKTDALPAIMYLSPLIVAAITTLIFVKFKKNKLVILGLLFYIGTFLPLLQFLPIGKQIIAERYTYIPYIGLGIMFIGWLLSLRKEKQLKIQIGLSLAIVIMLFLTHQRVSVWRNTEVLWTDVLEKYPDTSIAYINRGFWYNKVGKYKQGLADANAGIAIDPKDYKLWDNRGVSHQNLKLYKEAVEDYTTSISLHDNNTVPLINRGILYTDKLNEYDKGIADFKKLLAFNPAHYDAMCNMGVAYIKKQSLTEAKNALEKAIQIDSNEYKAYELLAIVLNRLGDKTNAKINSEKATRLKANHSN